MGKKSIEENTNDKKIKEWYNYYIQRKQESKKQAKRFIDFLSIEFNNPAYPETDLTTFGLEEESKKDLTLDQFKTILLIKLVDRMDGALKNLIPNGFYENVETKDIIEKEIEDSVFPQGGEI